VNFFFYLAAIIAVISTALVITRLSAVHALLYLIVSLLAVAVIFFLLGAPFVAALEVIIYAGAIMVLFVFVIMMLNLGPASIEREHEWFKPVMLIGPTLLAAILLAEIIFAFARGGGVGMAQNIISPRELGIALYGPYVLGVELSSMLLLAGLIGAYHLGRRVHRRDEEAG